MDDLERAGIPRIIASVLVCTAAGGVGAVATGRSVNTWYRTIRKPPFTPPDSVFGPVWTVLYVLMGLALAIVGGKGTDTRLLRAAQALFGVQLTLNALWSVFFFGRRSPIAALIDIALLWVALLVTIALFFRISRPAALMLIPYLAWVTFAALLNGSIWRLNR